MVQSGLDMAGVSRDGGLACRRLRAIGQHADGRGAGRPHLSGAQPDKPCEPTKAEQYEIGVKYQPPGSDALLTVRAYRIAQQNLLTTDPEHPDFSRQTGEVRMLCATTRCRPPTCRWAMTSASATRRWRG